MNLGPTEILDAHAEAFSASYTRLIVTAADEHWLGVALSALCGYGTSIIGCDCEIAVERKLGRNETPDGCTAAAVMAFHPNREKLAAAVANRVGQGLLTCPTAAVFNGLTDSEETFALGDHLRYFGDGSEWYDDAFAAWQVPTMEGDWLVPPKLGVAKGVAGGNLILQGADETVALAAAERASSALRDMPGVITPFPGGVCRSGSKVGSQYANMIASINEYFCPSLRQQVESKLLPKVACAYEIVINGVDEQTVREAIGAAIHAAAGEGILAITAGEYGGKLGKIQIPIREVL